MSSTEVGSGIENRPILLTSDPLIAQHGGDHEAALVVGVQLQEVGSQLAAREVGRLPVHGLRREMVARLAHAREVPHARICAGAFSLTTLLFLIYRILCFFKRDSG